MNTAEIRTKLKAAADLAAKIETKEAQLAATKAAKQRLTAIPSPTPRSPSNDPHWMESIITAESTLRTEIEAAKASKADVLRAIYATIALASSPLERKILTMRYCARLSWKEIAETTGYSDAHLYRLHRHALEEIAQHP